MKERYDELQAEDSVARVERLLSEALEQKRAYEVTIKKLEAENKEQGIQLTKVTTGEEYQK